MFQRLAAACHICIGEACAVVVRTAYRERHRILLCVCQFRIVARPGLGYGQASFQLVVVVGHGHRRPGSRYYRSAGRLISDFIGRGDGVSGKICVSFCNRVITQSKILQRLTAVCHICKGELFTVVVRAGNAKLNCILILVCQRSGISRPGFSDRQAAGLGSLLIGVGKAADVVYRERSFC